jgi:arabinosyltransferase C
MMRRFSVQAAIAAVILAALPVLVGLLLQNQGAWYLQQQFAMDDQMVYSAWMKQAGQGHFLFDNRFAVDAQPGLTIHLYFLVLGWIGKIIGIPGALTLGRLVFAGLFVFLLGRFVEKLGWSLYASKLAVVLAAFGGGVGFACWEPFGRVILKTSPVSLFTGSKLPTDVWQPEAFGFPSMLTNGLFMASLCLFLVIFDCVLRAKESWKPVPLGAAAFFVLMNIHSYDVLLLALVLVGTLTALVGAKQFDRAWVVRVAVIGLGAVPTAGYFLWVLQQDAVFQARAGTLTYTDNFRQILAGVLPALVLGLIGLFRGGTDEKAKPSPLPLAIFGGVVVLLTVLSFSHADGYFLTPGLWGVAFVGVLAALFLSRPKDPMHALVWAWALVALVAPYFPGLFQRKLSMGLAIPWGIVAAAGIAQFTGGLDRSKRNLATALGLIVFCLSSLMWVRREMEFVRMNVSVTTLHPVTLSRDAVEILKALEKEPGRRVVLAMPGVAQALETPGDFGTPLLPDLNPFAAGVTGAYAYAGHWSETPDYERRRGVATAMFLVDTSDEARQRILEETGATHLIAPLPEAFPGLPLADVRGLGTVVEEDGAFALVRL